MIAAAAPAAATTTGGVRVGVAAGGEAQQLSGQLQPVHRADGVDGAAAGERVQVCGIQGCPAAITTAAAAAGSPAGKFLASDGDLATVNRK